jgi:hypothetical protein
LQGCTGYKRRAARMVKSCVTAISSIVLAWHPATSLFEVLDWSMLSL